MAAAVAEPSSNSSALYLSDGLLELIMSQRNNRLTPIVQILNIKHLAPSRIRALISDGKSCVSSCMFVSEQANLDFQQGKLSKFTVIRADEYVVDALDQSPEYTVVMIHKYTILKSGLEINKKLDSGEQFLATHPTPSTTTMANNPPVASGSAHFSSVVSRPRPTPAPKAPKQTVYVHPGRLLMRNIMAGAGMDPDYYLPLENDDDHIYDDVLPREPNFQPINILTAWTHNWTIRARVIRKGRIRTYSNARGAGKLFDFEVKDESGHICVVAFNEACDLFFDKIKKHKVYYISKGTIKLADKRYNSADYQITLNSDSIIRATNNVRNISKSPTYHFTALSNIANKADGRLVDVIGIIRSVKEIEPKIIRKTQKEVPTRVVNIVDNSGTEVELTLWNEEAAEFTGQAGQVIALKDVSVKEFQGKKLSTLSSSFIEINPNMTEARKLTEWYRNIGSGQQFTPICEPTPKIDFSYIAQIRDIIFKSPGKQFYFNVSVIINDIGPIDRHFYTACPAEACSKKVTVDENGEYACPNPFCRLVSTECKMKIKTGIQVSDATGSLWITVFNSLAAEKLFGKSEQELVRLYQTNLKEYGRVVQAVKLRQLQLRVGAKATTYNDQPSLSCTLVRVESSENNRAKNLMSMIDIISRQV